MVVNECLLNFQLLPDECYGESSCFFLVSGLLRMPKCSFTQINVTHLHLLTALEGKRSQSYHSVSLTPCKIVAVIYAVDFFCLLIVIFSFNSYHLSMNAALLIITD